MANKFTKEDFIERAKMKHGDKYDYSKTIYVNKKTKVIITCPIHGDFEQLAQNHMGGSGCPKCRHDQDRMTLEEFISKAKEVHGDKYDYGKVNYVNYGTKVIITCKKHGDFEQSPRRHIFGNGCPICKKEKISKKNQMTYEVFIEKAKIVHGDNYSYDKNILENRDENKKLTIKCNKCGNVFKQTLANHLSGQQCPFCYGTHLKTNKEFIEDAIKVHGDRYDYSKVEYLGNKKHIIIICPIHGEFKQTPNDHLRGKGCPHCKQSHIESFITKLFNENNINYIKQKRFKWLGRQSLDFYLPDYSIAIECQGEQHFLPIEAFGGENGLKRRKELDYNKLKLCNENNVKLLYFAFKQYDENIITDEKILLEEIMS